MRTFDVFCIAPEQLDDQTIDGISKLNIIMICIHNNLLFAIFVRKHEYIYLRFGIDRLAQKLAGAAFTNMDQHELNWI